MKELKLPRRIIKTDLDSFIMGIVNCTPDSFFEKSRGGLEHALSLIEQGADILDIGGESTRPGASYVSEEDEIKRIIPVIEAIRKKSDIPISVDTRKFNVMKEAFECGADILNDISSFEDNPQLMTFAAQKKLTVILMHKRGIPDIMQENTIYKDVFSEVSNYLLERASLAEKHGIETDRIIVDPGIGFGKNLSGNSVLIKNCGKLCNGKYKVLMALSRKTCIGEITGRSVENRLDGTVAADLIAVMNGASLLRVHDVQSCKDSLKVLKTLNDSSL